MLAFFLWCIVMTLVGVRNKAADHRLGHASTSEMARH
jgi:hypothetical protein